MIDDVMVAGPNYPELEKAVYCVMTKRDWKREETQPDTYCVAVYHTYERAEHWVSGNMANYYWICRTALVD